MKKLLFGLTTLFIASQLLVSCNSKNEALSQFSKRKYLKKYKAKNVNQKTNFDKIDNSLTYALNTQEFVSSNRMVETILKENTLSKTEGAIVKKVVGSIKNTIDLKKDYSKNYSSWNSYNRKIDLSPFNYKNKTLEKHSNSNNLKRSEAAAVVVAILCVFIPPLAVFLYEGTITTNFWVDLVATLLFWLPGIILAFLICFGGVSF